MPVIKLIDDRAKIVTKWNGEDMPRHGKAGDTATFPSVPSHWVSGGAVEVVSEEEPKREFIVNPAPDASGLADEYTELTGRKPDGRWSDARLQEEIDKALSE